MIHALPGMGANRLMYPPPWNEMAEFRAHDWVAFAGERSLAEVARAMAETLGIRDGDVLVGSSLGGMVAGEIARFRRIPRLYLVGSAVHPGEISPLLAALYPLAQVAPLALLRISAGSIPLELAQMFAQADPAFLRAMVPAIFAWQGIDVAGTRIIRLHGRHDLVIPPPPVPDLLLDCGHLPAMTHARECAAFIAECERQAAASRAGG